MHPDNEELLRLGALALKAMTGKEDMGVLYVTHIHIHIHTYAYTYTYIHT